MNRIKVTTPSPRVMALDCESEGNIWRWISNYLTTEGLIQGLSINQGRCWKPRDTFSKMEYPREGTSLYEAIGTQTWGGHIAYMLHQG